MFGEAGMGSGPTPRGDAVHEVVCEIVGVLGPVAATKVHSLVKSTKLEPGEAPVVMQSIGIQIAAKALGVAAQIGVRGQPHLTPNILRQSLRLLSLELAATSVLTMLEKGDGVDREIYDEIVHECIEHARKAGVDTSSVWEMYISDRPAA